ncbi:LLM class flavin-dependent oxidoreductase [Paraburkholderia bryophila]|uniref:Alkanesulfonate monooxygenase SsuD/methylene tetrahydromethanopterin reductase-like flavin-dependent oxidoreductase (Luciferase family) n=1 Tax=Paraburkholderia bryophila TaxID=420952 RepID=A0A329CYN9_9BURK|nr:LLM class flavin-dependent oxidoreductase [Paraburkholderia bryophila]RAS39217.1 alkanesulfonate monooxygenase SsuD/methylene tetrahydromethanopterin reductase-like flavin-dependent oxidoreductase (luciferase family) [Paraburkholderia bryophila]
MQFGLFLTLPAPEPRPAAELYERALAMAEAADTLGFSHLWLAEHHFTNYSHSSRPLMLLSHIAARTQHLRLGPAIVPVPLHHPLVIAEELATLDVLSGGRVEAGLGSGYQRYQYERFQLTKGAGAARDDEAIDVLLKALREPLFSHRGEHFEIPRTGLVPQPLQRAIPLWLVVNSSRRPSVEQAVKRRANLFTGVLEPISKLTDVRRRYPDLADALATVRIGTQRPVFVAENEAQAREAVEHARWNGRATLRLRHDLGDVVDGIVPAQPLPDEPSDDVLRNDFLVIGTADECIHQLRRIQTGLGCDYFSASFWFGSMPHDMAMASMRRFARDVMPAFAREKAAEAHEASLPRPQWESTLAW